MSLGGFVLMLVLIGLIILGVVAAIFGDAIDEWLKKKFR